MSQRPIIGNVERFEQGNQSNIPRSVVPSEHVSPVLTNDRELLRFPSGKRTGSPLKVQLGHTLSSQSVAAAALDRSTLTRLQSTRIAIKTKGKFLFLFLADIVAIEAKGNYVLLHHTSSSHILRESISTMERRFSAYGFVRIHRSALVNAASVEEIQPWSTGEYMLRVRSGRDYAVTRTYKHNLHRLAACWLGGDGFCSDGSSPASGITDRAGL